MAAKGKKRSASEASESALTSYCKVKTEDDFNELFGEYFVIPRARGFRLGQWNPVNNLDHAKKILAWIEAMAPTWVATHAALPLQNNERTLYPAVFDILRDCLLLTNAGKFITAVTVDVSPMEEDVKAAAVEGSEAFKLRRSPRSSTTSASAKVDEVFAATAVDLSDSEGVANLFCEIEKKLKERNIDGYAEFVISEALDDPVTGRPRNKIRIIVEVKKNLLSDSNAGFYQLSAELAAKVEEGETIFGIYTDASAYEFACVALPTASAQDTRQIMRSPRHQFVLIPEPGQAELQNGALTVLAHIFEMLGVPPTIDMDQRLKDIAAAQEAMKDKFLQGVRASLKARE